MNLEVQKYYRATHKYDKNIGLSNSYQAPPTAI